MYFIKKTNIIILILLSFGYAAKSQNNSIKKWVLDSLTNEPIPYADLISLRNKYGKYTNQYGVFYTDSLDNDIQISHIGHFPKIVHLAVCSDTIYNLKYGLDDVIVKPTKRERYELGYLHNRSPFTAGAFSGYEMAVYIKNSLGE